MRALSGGTGPDAALPVTGRALEMAALYSDGAARGRGRARTAPSRSPIGWGKRAWPAPRDGAAPAAGGGTWPLSPGSGCTRGPRDLTRPSIPGAHTGAPRDRGHPARPLTPPHSPVVVTGRASESMYRTKSGCPVPLNPTRDPPTTIPTPRTRCSGGHRAHGIIWILYVSKEMLRQTPPCTTYHLYCVAATKCHLSDSSAT